MKRHAIFSILLIFPILTYAGVNPRNGDFFVAYQDVSLAEGRHGLGIKRVYNSLATELGWFGYGWGSDYETRLVVLPDGSAAVKENGSGRTSYYRTSNVQDVKFGVQKIVELASKRERLSPVAASELTEKLIGDEDLRLKTVVKYDLRTNLDVGKSLGDECGAASLKRITSGYQRVNCNRFGDSEASVDNFDLMGRLVRRETNSGYAVTIRYQNSVSAVLVDTLGKTIELNWGPKGRVATAKSNKGTVKYTYDDNNDLIKSEIEGGLSYGYSYDNNHNLTRITYIDTTSIFISYSPGANGMTDSVTDRFGEQETYVYRTDSNDPNRYWTTKTVISKSGATSSQEYEFQQETGKTGITQLSKIGSSGDSGAVEKKFDEKGRVIFKTDSAGKVVEYAYHPKSGKLSTVITDGLRSDFIYDAKGNLVQASNSDGKKIYLTYAKAESIQSVAVISQEGEPPRELRFKYNSEGKPSRVTVVGRGYIEIEYDATGEISMIKSPYGESTANFIATVFQDLLSMVSVAGVSF